MSLAFFDIDGTLMAKPSLELRFFLDLRRSGQIPAASYLRWVQETLRLGWRDFPALLHTNKSYLRGLPAQIFCAADAPAFFPAGVGRVWWHALRGDSIVLVSGTPAPLAAAVKFALERELLGRGVETKISVAATQLEIRHGRLTGRVAGQAMFGEAKEAAVREFSRASNVSLEQCSAYGDSSLDRWMLAAVGRPYAVNPTARMGRLSRQREWPILAWTDSAGEAQLPSLKKVWKSTPQKGTL